MRAESALQQQIMTLLAIQHPELVAVAIPNGAYFFGSDRTKAAITVRGMKRAGLLTPGAADIVLAGQGRCVFIEIKVPASRDLLGKRRDAGRLSKDQEAYAARCAACRVPYFICRSWDEVETTVRAVWGNERHDAA